MRAAMTPMKPSAVMLLAVMLLAAVPASAQFLRAHDTNAPVDVSAARIEVQDRTDRAIFAGDVRVTQGAMRLNAQRITVAYAGGTGSVQIRRIDAVGGVSVTSGDQSARGDQALYDLPRRLITMVGNVRLAQGGNVLTGGRLVIDLTSGRATVEGGAPGVTTNGGRVTGRFTVSRN